MVEGYPSWIESAQRSEFGVVKTVISESAAGGEIDGEEGEGKSTGRRGGWKTNWEEGEELGGTGRRGRRGRLF